MVMHELLTNAAKHGALSGEDGRIEIMWGVGAGERFNASWVELDGPPVVAPRHRGFGTKVVTAMAEMSLDGEAKLDYAASGLTWHLSCPLANVLEA
jgi:two-component sensor histidine kinase